ncbi:MAG: molybdopterin-guanine dinucleotide biosynthesis protein B [Pseudomonadota bacterium]
MTQVVSIVGNSSSGKTTLIEKLIAELKSRGYRIGSIKHAHHGYAVDMKGKDSWRHKNAGADTVIISSPGQIVMVKDDLESESLDTLEKYFQDVDLVIAEGFKKEARPKIEIFRVQVHSEPLFKDNDNLVAMVSDSAVKMNVPVFGLEEIQKLADFIETRYIHSGKS